MITKTKARFGGLVVAAVFALTGASAQAQTTAELQAQIAALMAQLAALQAPAVTTTFTMDLTMGSTGPQVVALQTYLESKGYLVMPAGVAKGYFGALTRAAVAKFQAANGIAPAVGYFGPVTRAKVNSMVVVTPGGPVVVVPGSPSGLQGGEASLEDYELEDEESSGNEGAEDVEIATATFDVEDGDARIERVQVDFQAEDVSDSVRPWDYFDSVSIWLDGEKLGEMDVDNRDDWDEDDADSDHDASAADWYRLTFTGLNGVVREGDTANLTIAANIAGSIDSADLTQEFTVSIPDDGIRAVDGAGIMQYIGDADEVVDNFGFEEEESGDLDIESSSEDPDTMTLISDEDDESDEYMVFAFEMENNDNADTLVTDITLTVATSSGISLLNVLDSATLVAGGDEYDCDINANGTLDCDDMEIEVGGDDTETFELVVVLREDAPDTTLKFTVAAAGVTAEGVDSGDDADVSGTVSSETHTVSTAGIMVDGTSTATSISEDGDTGTFEIKFTVEALEEDVYIYNGADQSTAASTTGVVYNIYKGGALVAATTTDSAVLQSSADKGGLGDNWYVVEAGESETFTLTVALNPDSSSSALYSVELEAILFDDVADTTANDTTYTLPNDSEFETSSRQID